MLTVCVSDTDTSPPVLDEHEFFNDFFLETFNTAAPDMQTYYASAGLEPAGAASMDMMYAPAPMMAMEAQPMMSFPGFMCTQVMTAPSPMMATGVVAKPSAAMAKLDLSGKAKRGKKRRRRAFAVDDPRRGYVDSIFGAFNQGEGLLAVLNRIATSDVLLTCKFIGDPASLNAGKLYREVRGRELIANFVDTMLLAGPDTVLKLHEKKMRLRQNNSSYIVAKYTMEGWKFCSILTTNDKHSSKKVEHAKGLRGMTTVPMGKNNEVPTVTRTSSGSAADAITTDDEWSDSLLDEMSEFSGSPILEDFQPVVSMEDNKDEKLSHLLSSCVHNADVERSIQEKSELMLATGQFKNRNVIPSGFNEKISIAGNNSEFGLSNSLPAPILVSTIGTMALHINPNRQVHRIDFLWTYMKAKKEEEK